MAEIKAVLFDWDFTLGAPLGNISTGKRFSILLERAGFRYKSNAITAAINRRRQDIQEGRLHGKTEPQTRQECVVFYQQILAILGHAHVSSELANELYDSYARLPFRPYKDTLSTLQALAVRGLRMGIITNYSSAVRPVIESVVQELIQPKHIIISDELGLYKPDKDVFIEAAKRVKEVPSNCVYVGDNLEVDAIAAVSHGGYALGLWLDRRRRGMQHKPFNNVYRITSLTEVSRYVMT